MNTGKCKFIQYYAGLLLFKLLFCVSFIVVTSSRRFSPVQDFVRRGYSLAQIQGKQISASEYHLQTKAWTGPKRREEEDSYKRSKGQ